MEQKPDAKAADLYLAARSRMTIILHEAERIERDLHTAAIAAAAHRETQLFAMLLESVELHLRLANTQIRSLILETPEPAKNLLTPP